MKLSVLVIFISTVFYLQAGCAVRTVFEPVEPVEPVIENPILQQLDVTVLHKADYNIDDSQTVRGFRVIETDVDYRTELARYSIELPKPVDFAQQRVLLSTMGTQQSGGYVVSVVKAEEYAEEVVVAIEFTSPGDNCITTSALSNPYEFVLLNTVKPVRAVESEITTECAETELSE